MTISSNRKAHYEFSIVEKAVAGIVLEGWEVKSIRKNGAQIQEAYITIRGGEVFLEKSHIAPLFGSSPLVPVEPLRKRKMLLKGEEIAKLAKKVDERGFTLIPLDLHFSKGLVKCTLGLAKGKKLHDKRQTVKDRDAKREVDIEVKAKTSRA
jgi:SsrA-binding protein